MARRLIGTGTTDSNGRVTVSYSGKGAGKLQLVAVNGNLLSEIYVLEDLLYYDHGTYDDHNDNNWSTWSNYPCTITRQTLWTGLAQTTSGTTGYHLFGYNSLSPSVIEFDIFKDGGNVSDILLQLRNNSRGVVKQWALSSFNNLSLNQWYHVVFDFSNNSLTIGDSSSSLGDTAATYLYFAVNGTTTSVNYKNFKVY